MEPLEALGPPNISHSKLAIFRCRLMSISLEDAERLFISVHMASCARPYTVGAHLLVGSIVFILCHLRTSPFVADLLANCNRNHNFAKAGLSFNNSRLMRVGGHNHSKSIQKLKSTLHWWHMHSHLTLIYKTNSCLTVAGRSIGMKQHRSSAKRRYSRTARRSQRRSLQVFPILMTCSAVMLKAAVAQTSSPLQYCSVFAVL